MKEKTKDHCADIKFHTQSTYPQGDRKVGAQLGQHNTIDTGEMQRKEWETIGCLKINAQITI